MSIWTGQSKSSASWSGQNRSSSSWTSNSFLLKEDTFYLLQETGDKIILDAVDNGKHDSTWTGQNKS